nr:MAG TPA: hypothetical protein [Caudoviricetes sp.]
MRSWKRRGLKPPTSAGSLPRSLPSAVQEPAAQTCARKEM